MGDPWRKNICSGFIFKRCWDPQLSSFIVGFRLNSVKQQGTFPTYKVRHSTLPRYWLCPAACTISLVSEIKDFSRTINLLSIYHCFSLFLLGVSVKKAGPSGRCCNLLWTHSRFLQYLQQHLWPMIEAMGLEGAVRWVRGRVLLLSIFTCWIPRNE